MKKAQFSQFLRTLKNASLSQLPLRSNIDYRAGCITRLNQHAAIVERAALGRYRTKVAPLTLLV